ncbi:MAG: hypothetical protein PHY62_09175 [Gallionella sp.]|nr:hypothetical protein [Gallionella sp.]
MARYKHIDTSPRFLAVDLQRQLLPGTFEHALNHLLDREIDLSGFRQKMLMRSKEGRNSRIRPLLPILLSATYAVKITAGI